MVLSKAPDVASQICTLLYSPAAARYLPSGLNATLFTQPFPPSIVRSRFPVEASHSMIRLSPEPVASRRPSGLNATLFTQPLWSLQDSCRSDVASQSLSVRSSLAERILWPSRLNDRLLTPRVCPRKIMSFWPLIGSQSLIVWSAPAEARRRPSGLKDRALTKPRCPSRGARWAAVTGFQSLIVLSHPPVAS